MMILLLVLETLAHFGSAPAFQIQGSGIRKQGSGLGTSDQESGIMTILLLALVMPVLGLHLVLAATLALK